MTKAAELAKIGEVATNSQIGGRRNIIINGGMQVAQRSASVTGLGAASGYFTLDRFKMEINSASAGRFTMSQSAVTDLDGFSNALKIDCTTADTSIAAGEVLILRQHIEGLNCQQLKASSTSTNAFTLSFYAKSNASRVIASELRLSSGTNRQAVKVHTIGTSWARYTFTVAAASSTEIDNDNTTGLQANFFIHGGSTFTGGTVSATLESDTAANRAAGIGSIFASTNNTLEITGVQLEVGSQATPFEHRSFGEELALCQRYYQQSYAHGTAAGTATATSQVIRFIDATQSYGGHWITFRTEMRAAPTGNVYNTSTGNADSIRDDNGNHAADVGQAATHGMHCYANGSSIGTSESLRVQYTADAEL
tara:strand:- start:46 stop:1143 length:1098 start_codon:yes stop_codon:yes gene_type:complete